MSDRSTARNAARPHTGVGEDSSRPGYGGCCPEDHLAGKRARPAWAGSQSGAEGRRVSNKCGEMTVRQGGSGMRNQRAGMTRREFVGGTAAALAGISIVPRHVLGGADQRPPSEKLNIAAIGAGGQGAVGRRGPGRREHRRPVRRRLAAIQGDVQEVPPGQAVSRFPQDARRDGQADRCGAGGHARPHARRGRHGRHQARQARLLREAAGPLGVGSAPAREGGPRAQGRHAARQPGPLIRQHPLVLRMDLGRRDRQRAHHPRRLRCSLRRSTPRSASSRASRRSTRSRPSWTGTSGWARRPTGLTTRPICRSSGAAGRPSAPGVLGDWVCHVLDPVFWALDLGAPSSVKAEQGGELRPREARADLPAGTRGSLRVRGQRQTRPDHALLVRRLRADPATSRAWSRTPSRPAPARSFWATRAESCTARTGPAACSSSPRRR